MVKKKRVHRVTKKKEQDSVYVRIDSALTLRREILETAIESTALLKRWESYKILREMKLAEIKELKKIMDNIEKEFREFKKHLPKVEIKEEEKPREIQKEEKKEAVVKDSGLSEIDSEIEELKARLSQLKI